MKNSTVKVSYAPYLRDKTPEQWARLIRRHGIIGGYMERKVG